MANNIGVVMGSISDWSTMKLTCDWLDKFGIGYEKHVISAHRMPNELYTYGSNAVTKGLKVIVAGAGGAAHLPGMLAANTTLPVIGVPIKTRTLNGVDSLLSIVQMPFGAPVATVSIGEAGAKNAALLAIQILAINDSKLTAKLMAFKEQQRQEAITSEQQFN
ncbi:N5-carboxyaminoimidazole ribonucleotide mutase [Loigolactobacillus backii]|uniref:5-(carboxyamino)imidazole ribonucleotide mutase n=1 Tax=Loigolactobacillus backii TaxID=375175 RepID=UPI0007F0E062|nr:5-(carboxyamino)imidazole ribonucleotide mutase [Loigolactobacillus backii]ANK60676.1 N5-carboxyaminoimidazole ribonucleotide mutase [Loigolactobacillus backii]ANK65629.1 N5-carboxyaminoimidazole ribonucleotide mutase [Loigolactobacillus backii]ANK68104.1 N5-carboxyaminoimidazole ribonucleotide mutase [Loigolactobacillus backii]OLF69658.1 N5-carboxyaminoimidazole ribonucleotide mutase [Loigolactobacillus backii]PIO86681.1 5-(carboxyamino)imidazole ribonucleotide mutase [Loigolactobacillus b